MYIPLKVTTDNTLLQSLIKIPDLITFLVTYNIKACGIVDNTLSGVIDFYFACKKNNIKPIIGLSITINTYEIYLYALNYRGYQDLIKINELIELNKFTSDSLKEYANNILVIIPSKSIDIYDTLAYFNYRYLGYSNEYEKNIALNITSNAVFVEDIRALNSNDVNYLKYLDLMKNNSEYHHGYYQDYDYIDNNKIQEIVDLINIDIPTDKRYIPRYNNLSNSYTFLCQLSIMGLRKRLHNKVTIPYQERLKYELGVINKMGFVDYFLIVYDYSLYAKKNKIACGIRGSAAGSLVCFAIGITDIDPLQYNLLFERFLNPERITMPDIDMDFDSLKREEVINYVKEKYGSDKVALGLTFNTLKSKLVIREVGKILKVKGELIDKFAKVIDGTKSLKENLDITNVKKYLSNYSELKKVYNIAMKLEGLKKNTSIHAAGVIISSTSLNDLIPTHYENNTLITGITMEHLETMGLLKMDFLGLNNLTIIANVLARIDNFSLKDIPLDDKKVFKLFREGDTDGIFQFETPLMKTLVMRLQPSTFTDLISAVALGRPGPKEHAEEFIERKKGKKKITYIHPDLEDILKETEGILIYQEQIIAILGKIANYSYAEADLIRRAISKKKESIIKEEETKFIKRAINNGYTEDVSKAIYDLIAKFASYGFNKSHSVVYAHLAYQMAYLKVYYTGFFVSELLNTNGFNISLINYLKKQNIKINKPSINNKYIGYYYEDNNLYMPLSIIKDISSDIALKILNCKEESFTDIFDFCYKTKDFMTKDILNSLIKSGSMDSFNMNHTTLYNAISSALNYGELQDDLGLIEKPIIVEYSSDVNELEEELDSYGFYITNHPASKYDGYVKLNDIKNNLFKKVTMIVLVENIKTIKTKKNEDMAFIRVSDETNIDELTVFPSKYNLLNNIKKNDLIWVIGEVTKRFDKYNIIVNNIRKVE